MLRYLLIFLLFCEFIQKENVYFTKNITSSNMIKLLQKLNVKLSGNIGLKIHSGEIGGKYFLHPNFLQEIYDYTNGTFIECNTAYRAGRHSTEEHRKVLAANGWLDNNRRTVIMDEDPNSDFNLSISDPAQISENIVGAHLNDFNSSIVLAHFKGHGMGGFGGALKQLSIGFASQRGKTWIHSAGRSTDWTKGISGTSQIEFTNSMGDAASSIVKYFRERGGIAFISVMANISKSCDCAGARAPEPKIHDIGILASTDPVALDRACLDLIKKYVDNGTEELLNQIDRLEGENTIFVAEKHGIGSQEYNFIDIDDSESSNLTFIIIICLIVLAIVIAGIVIFMIFKRKSQQDQQTEESPNSGDDNKLMDE